MDIRVNAQIAAEQLLPLYRQTAWAAERDAQGVGRMLKATSLHVSAWDQDRLVGFARVVTDGVYRALVDDVMVDEGSRRQGVGTALMQALVECLADVEEVFLGCDQSVIPFYEKLGWRKDQTPGMAWETAESS